MGKLEKELRAEVRKSKINKALIGTIAVAGVVAMGVVAPNALGALAGTRYFRQRLYQARTSLGRLIQKGYVQIETRGDKKYVRLTKKGEGFAALLGEGKFAIQKPKRWDKKWRMLIFDIPERRRGTRNNIRNTLVALGLYRLQDSVWVYPYDCEDVIILLKADLRVGKDLLYIIAEKIEYDSPLRKHFGLV